MMNVVYKQRKYINIKNRRVEKFLITKDSYINNFLLYVYVVQIGVTIDRSCDILYNKY